MNDDWLDLEWWEHPKGGIDWQGLMLYGLTIFMIVASIAIFVWWMVEL